MGTCLHYPAPRQHSHAISRCRSTEGFNRGEHPPAPGPSIASLDIQQSYSNLGDVLEVEVLVALLVVAESIRLIDTDCTHCAVISAHARPHSAHAR